MQSAENWKDVVEVGYEDRYEVSDQGAVRVKYGYLLKPRFDKNGLCSVTLSKSGSSRRFFVHRLVLSTFIGAALPDQVGRHRDENNANNRLTNLYWDTPPRRKSPAYKAFRVCEQVECRELSYFYAAGSKPGMYCQLHLFEILGQAPHTPFRHLTITERSISYHTIYLITCNVNGKVYVGQTNNAPKRNKQHFSHLERGDHWNRDLQADYNRYGATVFTFQILEENIPSINIIYRETYWIRYFHEIGYNLMWGDGRNETLRRTME
jgi:hypothetical protein